MSGIGSRSGHARTLPWFGLSFAVACAALVLFGFSHTFVPEVVEKLRPAWLYIHIATAAAWLALVVAQAALAMRRKLALHRRIGGYGFVLGAVAAITAFITALVLRHEAVATHGADHRIDEIAFLAIPLNGAVAFTALLLGAWVWRHRPPFHRRFMLLATAVLTLPAVARIPWISALGPLTIVPTDLLVLALCGVDLWRDRAIHRIYWVAVPAIIGLQFLAVFLAFGHPNWWVQTASLLIGA